MIVKILFFMLSLSAAGMASAFFPGKGERLLHVAEWERFCAERAAPAAVAFCRVKIHLAVANGRSLPPFELIETHDKNLLQSRSGVFFRGYLNEGILEVREDFGLRTTVGLADDVQCQAYAAPLDLVGIPSAEYSYDRLIQGWLGVYTDAKSRLGSVSIEQRLGNPMLRFVAAAAGDRVIQGRYQIDPLANAAIFSTCDQPADSIHAQQHVDRFFNAIVGSARRFI